MSGFLISILLMNIVIIDLEEQMHLNIHFVFLVVQKGQLEFCYLLEKKGISPQVNAGPLTPHMNWLNHCSFYEILKQICLCDEVSI